MNLKALDKKAEKILKSAKKLNPEQKRIREEIKKECGK